MSLTAQVIEYIADIVYQTGYLGIFILMTLESCGIPIPSEAVVTFSGFISSRGGFEFWYVIIVSTIANLTGSLIFYYIGYRYGLRFFSRYGRYLHLSEESINMVKRWFDRYGDIAVFIGRVTPAVRTYISFPAGLSSMRLSNFIILTLVGSLIWNIILTYIGFILGEHWMSITPILDYLTLAVIVSLVLTFIFLKRRGINII